MSSLDADLLYSFIEPDSATRRVEDYFRTKPGRYFETLGGGGDRHEVADVLTAEDVIAACLLGMDFKKGEPVDLLVTRTDEISAHLREIPTGVDLWALDGVDYDENWQDAELVEIPPGKH